MYDRQHHRYCENFVSYALASPDSALWNDVSTQETETQNEIMRAAFSAGVAELIARHGEPQNLIKVCQHLRQHYGASHVGIVYNFHHGHDAVKNFAADIRAMEPYLLCVNINGMADERSMKTVKRHARSSRCSNARKMARP